MQVTMGTSGVESLNAAGNIFVGQVQTWKIDAAISDCLENVMIDNSWFVQSIIFNHISRVF